MTFGSCATLIRAKPAIEAGLKVFINRHAEPHKITPRMLWLEFSALCFSSGVAADQLPRSLRDHGRRALVRWLNSACLVKSDTPCTRPNSARNASSHVSRRSK